MSNFVVINFSKDMVTEFGAEGFEFVERLLLILLRCVVKLVPSCHNLSEVRKFTTAMTLSRLKR